MLTQSTRVRSSATAARSSTSTLLATAISLALASAAANAQDQSKQPPQALPKVSVQAESEQGYKAETVSSPKFTQPLVDTPQTISVVTKEVINQQATASLSEALRNTPGITFLMGENGNTATGDSIFMRGFDTQGSIFVDNIRDLGTITRDTFNTEQVEIAKGPSGPDNGRGAASGYINMATKVPGLEDFSEATLRYGENDSKRATADINHNFGDSGIGVRLNVMAQDGGVVGRDYIQRDGWAIAPSLGVGLGKDTRAYFYMVHTEQDNIPDGGVPTVGMDGFYNGTLGAASSSTARAARENFYGASNDFEDIEATMFTARIEHDFSPNVTLRNSSRYGKTEQFYVLTGVNNLGNLGTAPTFNDPSLWTVSRSRQTKSQENKLLTNQTNLATNFNTGAIQHSLTSGLEFIIEEQYAPGYANPGIMNPANLYNPDRNDPLTGAALAPTGAYNNGETTTIGLYVFDTIKVGERWQFTGGVRFDDYDTDYTNVAVAAGPTPPAGTLVATSASASDTLFSYKVGGLYKPAENGSVYLSYATSQQPPGGTNFTLSSSPTNINNPSLDPQEGSNLELGTKWDLLNGGLALTAAIFRSENKNELAQADLTDPTFVYQYGKKRVAGIELGIVGQITPDWQITAGLAKMDTEITEGTSSGNNSTGSVINWSPELTFTSWTSYRLPFGLMVGGGVRYVDTVSRSTNNTLNPATTNMYYAPDYWVIDAVAAYDITPRFTVQLNGYNLADELYVASLNNGGSRYSPGTPRTFALTVRTKF